MIKSVFFDWSNTLADFYPPREELQSQALRERGIDISTERVKPALFFADTYIYEANASKSLSTRSREELAALYTEYERILLARTGMDFPDDPSFLTGIIQRTQELFKDSRIVLYDDVIPVLSGLKQEGFTVGLITNIEYDMEPLLRELGLSPILDLVATSREVGVAKPDPEIFRFALERAGTDPDDSVHVGDSYTVDVEGARAVGINAILIDRHEVYPDVTDCPRIENLTELAAYL